MCGRVVQVTGPLQVAVLGGLEVPDTRFANVPPRYNAAPSQELWAIRQNHDTGECSLDSLGWGLVPYWSKAKPKPPPINAKSESVAKLPMFRDAYRRRRCIMPVDLFFEWKAIKGAKAKQPYAIGMTDGSAFGLAVLWENWRDRQRRVDQNLCDRHDGRQRAGGRDPRPHAGHPPARGRKK